MVDKFDSYEITCPCGYITSLSKRDFGWLDTIILHDDAGCAPKLNFLCDSCKSAFSFSYQKPTSVAQVDTPLAPLDVVITSVDFKVPVTLIVVRNKRTSEKQTHADIEEWIKHKTWRADKTGQVSLCLCPKE